MARPDRIPVLDALDVVPHPVAVDQPRAGGFGDADHPAVDMFGHAGDHVLRRVAEPLRPVLPDQIVIAADAAGGDDHGLRPQAEIADHLARTALAALDIVGLEDRAADAVDGAVGDRQRIDAVTEPEGQPAARGRFARPSLERLDNAGTGAPADMKPRHRIAVAHRIIAAALGPADHGKNPVAHRAQPAAFFARRERDISFRPALRPQILVAVEAGRAHPVLQREVETVLDAEPALFGRIDQEQSAERPERLAAEVLFALLVDHDDAFAGVGDFRGGDEASKTAADHDYICIVSHCTPSPQGFLGLKPASSPPVNGKRPRLRQSGRQVVPVWDLSAIEVQRACNTQFEFVLSRLRHLDKIAISATRWRQSCITQDGRVRQVLDWGWL